MSFVLGYARAWFDRWSRPGRHRARINWNLGPYLLPLAAAPLTKRTFQLSLKRDERRGMSGGDLNLICFVFFVDQKRICPQNTRNKKTRNKKRRSRCNAEHWAEGEEDCRQRGDDIRL